MMKTLKFIVLLTVMLVNVTPYIKDGKVEWKVNEAAAQFYTIENTGLGIWICGSYDNPDIILISRIQCNLLLPSQVSDEEPEFEDCFCEDCGIQKEFCQEPCNICGSTATVDDAGNVYPGTGNNSCKCMCGGVLETCNESSSCLNPLCPYISQHGSTNDPDLINISPVTVNTYPCINERSYSYKMDVYPIQGTGGFSSTYDEFGNETIHNNWCSIFLLGAVIGDKKNNICTDSMSGNNSIYLPENIARNYSSKYNRDIINNNTVGVAKIHEPEFYKSYGITLDTNSNISKDGCVIFEYFKNGNSRSGIFVNQSNHCFLIYGIKDETSMVTDPAKYILGDPKAFIYNTDNGKNHDYELYINEAVNFPGLFQKITK